MAYVILLLAIFVAPGISQIHLGPIGDVEVDCYHCDAHHPLPGCLDHPNRCHHDEVCSIRYGHGEPHIHCQKSEQCAHETEHSMRPCTGGGVEIHPDECQKCCSTTDCVSDLTNLLKIEAESSANLFCPGHCTANNLGDCITNGRVCARGQFCEVKKAHGEIKGECKEDRDMHHCQDELTHNACDHPVDHHHHGHDCFWDCCDTNDCLQAHFGSVLTTTAASVSTSMASSSTTTMTMASTQDSVQTTVAGNTMWERLNKTCSDQLEGNMCKDLVTSQDVCHDRLALSICPDTCGLCQAVANCHDTVQNGGCTNLAVHENVCADDLAIFICPQTCNKCQELINSVIVGLVDGSSNSTQAPSPVSSVTDVTPSSLPTFDCNELNNMDCGTIHSLCATSYMNVVCPEHCEACAIVQTASTKPPASVTSGDTALPSAQSTVDTTSDGGASTSLSPALPTNQSSTSTTCADHLTGMNCSELPDICTSVMAFSVCPKFCGLC